MRRAVSLFSGCGGSDLGLRAAGFDVVLANDIDSYAGDVHRANMEGVDFYGGDVADLVKWPTADLLIGCYPCQGFSQAGARDPSRRINYLYREFDRALRAIRPRAFIVENVSGMRYARHQHLLRAQLVRFRLAGYKVEYQELNAADFGVAQDRKRLFLVGIRSDLNIRYKFPTPEYGYKTNTPHISLGKALTDFPVWPEGEYFDDKFHWYYLSRNRRREYNEISRTIVSTARHIPLHPVSPTLEKLGPDCWRFTSEEPARRFSYPEAACLQGFPSNFIFPDTAVMRAKYRVIGNAVPPPLFAAIAKALPI